MICQEETEQALWGKDLEWEEVWGEEDEAEQGREEIVFVQAAELKSPIKQVRLVPQ